MKYCVETNSLCKNYKKFRALKDLTMHVPEGAIYGLVGKNGAGKTTLIRQICGLQQPTSGSYTLYGVKNDSSDINKARKRIGAVVESPSIYLEMTARNNLIEQYKMLGMTSYDGIDELLELVGLSNAGDKKSKNFSLGMRQRLGIAIALCGNPDFLILDEPINGLDPQGIIEIRELILKLNKERRITVLISSHILDELARLATHYGFMDNGVMIKEISAAELEKSFRKCTKVNVNNIKQLIVVLDRLNIEHKILENEEVEIYGKININRLVIELDKEGCEILSIHQHEESLENYYMNLIGGSANV